MKANKDLENCKELMQKNILENCVTIYYTMINLYMLKHPFMLSLEK